PLLHDGSLNFSFSGLKTAVRYHLDKHGQPKGRARHDFCASFQQAIVDVLVAKSVAAATKYRAQTFILGGGVAANTALRNQLTDALATGRPKVHLRLPNLAYCGDNAMLAALPGYYLKPKPTTWKTLGPDPNLSL
ncbi:MAG: tRNA (adenosine(37)-N6)-threonylcarbamoyltransferase complex transferase subunit TsaD, partial [Patescibacteria group bacterium]